MITLFESVKARVGTRSDPPYFGRFMKTESKEAAGLWSPALFEGDVRSNATAVEVSMLVLDFDGGHDWPDFESYWEEMGLEFEVHTTWSSTDHHPRWRAIFPLEAPVPASLWPEFARGMTDLLSGSAADTHVDPARIYYLPSTRVDTIGRYKRSPGLPIQYRVFEPEPEEENVSRETPGPTSGHLRVGDIVNDLMDWDELLTEAGGTKVRTVGKRTHWCRPGKSDRSTSATTGNGARGDLLRIHTSNWPPFEARSYDKFGFVTALRFGGDFNAATRELGAQYQPAKPAREFAVPAHLIPADVPTEVVEVWAPSDVTNAELVASRHGQNLRWVSLWGCWMVWDGTRWCKDETGGAVITSMAIETMRHLMVVASRESATKRARDMGDWAAKCLSASKLASMVGLLKSIQGIAVGTDIWDRHDHLLNTPGGTVNLYTGKTEPHNRDDHLTLITEAAPNGSCPVFERFLGEVCEGDLDKVNYLHRALGYSLMGGQDEQCFFFLYGAHGRNGKSTLVETVLHVLGSYAIQTPSDTWMTRIGDAGVPNDIARLRGARFVAAPEVEDGKRLNEGLVKRWTGGDEMVARFLHQEFFSFKPAGTLWISGNHRMRIGASNAIWRRVNEVPFNYVVPIEKVDARLMAKLRAEAGGILRWMVDGCLKWQESKLGRPEFLAQAIEEYRSESDVIGQFLDDRTVSGEGMSVSAGVLYRCYSQWCDSNGFKPLNLVRFSTALSDKNIAKQKDRNKHQWYIGIGLADPVVEQVRRGLYD